MLSHAAPASQADQQAQVKAKQELKNYLLSNEENKRIKEEAKEKDRLSDMRYNAQHAEILAKEEKVSLPPRAGPELVSPSLCSGLHPASSARRGLV